MNEFQKEMLDGIKKVRTGDMPIKTGKTIAKLGHRIVGDKNAECRMFKLGISDKNLQESMEAMEKAVKE